MRCKKCGNSLGYKEKTCSDCGTPVDLVSFNGPKLNFDSNMKAVMIMIIAFVIMGVISLTFKGDESENFYIRDEIYHTYYGDGFNFEYNDDWYVDTDGEKDMLYNKEFGNFFMFSWSSGLSGLSFSNEEDRRAIYNVFYEMYESQQQGGSIMLSDANDGFGVLKDNIYFAHYEYGKSSSEVDGNVYNIGSENHDYILSFFTSVTSEDSTKAKYDVKKILSSIEFIDGFEVEYNEFINFNSVDND